MKATELQREVIETCILNLAWWRGNNDIDSTSNVNELNSDFNELRERFGKSFADIEATMLELWKAIRFINTEEL